MESRTQEESDRIEPEDGTEASNIEDEEVEELHNR